MHAVVPAPDGSTASATYPMALWLSPPRFRIAWAAITSMRLLHSLFLMVEARMYLLLSARELEWYMNFVAPHGSRIFVQVAYLLALLAIVHAIELAQIFARSIQAKELVLEAPRSACMKSTPASRWRSLRRLLPKWLQSVVKHLSDFRLAIGVSGRYFKVYFLTREMIEMVSQTMQAFQASALISRSWINHLYVAALVINSWSTPLVERLTRHSLALQRVACLTTDLVLDSIMSIAVPILIVAPHIQELDTSSMTIDISVLYSLRRFNRLVMESRQVLVESWSDFIIKVIPHLSILGCLNSIQFMVRRKSTKIKHSRQAGLGTRPIGKLGPRKSFVNRMLATHSTRGRQIAAKYVALWLHGMFIVVGMIVVSVHLSAADNTYKGADPPVGCLEYLHPWLTDKVACSIYKYDCAEHDTLSPTEDSLDFLDEKSIVQIVIANCPQLEMPSTIQHFHNLLGIDIWDSAIKEWGENAAVTKEHNSLVYLGFLGTNMSTIPAGLLLDLPPQLHDIEITHCNLSTLPSELHQSWPQVSSLFVEFCELDHVPDTISHMQLYDLSLVGNKLTSVDILGQTSNHYNSVLLSRNPINVLPDSSINADVIAIDFTNVDNLPHWMPMSRQTIYAHATPVCDVLNDISSALTCTDSNLDKDGRYSVELVKSLNP